MTSAFHPKDQKSPPQVVAEHRPPEAPVARHTSTGQEHQGSFIGHHHVIDHALQRLQKIAETLLPSIPGAETLHDTHTSLISALTDVHEAAAEHFAHEEKLMEDTGFSQTDEHRQTHRFFLTLIQMEIDTLLHGLPRRGDPLCQTLCSWLISHSRHQDAELALFLCGGGPAPIPTG